MNHEDQSKKISQLIAKCWADDGFKKSLLADPAATLKMEGVDVPVGANSSVKALENTNNVFYLVIPAKHTDLSAGSKKMSQLITKCWADEGFKRHLLADPAAMLKAEGVELPAGNGLAIRALENSDNVFHLVIPAKPTDLSDEWLDHVVAAGCVVPTTPTPGRCIDIRPSDLQNQLNGLHSMSSFCY